MEDSESSWQFAEGDLITPGRYALRRFGGGHRCEAYLAFDERMHALVVVKIVRPDRADEDRARVGLEQEAEALARVNHPVAIRCYGAVLDGPRPHLAVEYVEGPRLSTLLRRYGPLAAEQAIPLGIQLFSVVHYLAQVGIVHLDIKPSNVIMGASPRLIDFSVALPAARAAELQAAVGTDAYMAPEQCDPQELGPVGPAADTWGAAITLTKAAAGSRPFDDPNPDRTEAEDRYPQLVDPPVIEAGAAELAPVLAPCLAREAAERPAPAQVADALEALLGEPSRIRVRRG